MVNPLDHQRLLGSIVAKYLGRGLCEEDLRAEGQIGLLTACRKYDPDRGPFAHYAAKWMHQTIGRAIDSQVSLIRVPAHVHEMIRYEKSTRHKNLAGCLKAGKRALRWHVNEGTLESRNEGATLASIAYDYRSEAVAEHAPSAELATLMQALSPREADIIRMRFGLGSHREMTQREVAAKLERSWQRIQQIEARAMAKLRTRATAEMRRAG